MTLPIAKLDRLARSVVFMSNLMEGGVDFAAADMPSVNRLMMHVPAAVAEHKREMISQRATERPARGRRGSSDIGRIQIGLAINAPRRDAHL